MDLHNRYQRILGREDTLLAGRKDIEKEIRTRVGNAFEGMMKALYQEKGASLRIDILQEPEVENFISTHADVLNSSMEKVPLSDAMRQRLERSNWVFSGMKTFHEMNEAFPSLIDSDGNRKPFEQFFNDVQKIDSTYNKDYLRAEYNFIQSSAEMAAKWEQFSEDGDRYYLQYRTAGDDKVRPEHAALNRVTLPMDDKFWEDYFPPNGWNCRCTVVQVRKSKGAPTPHDEAMALGEEATGKDTKGMFHFNPGKEGRTVPKYNPYTVNKCKTCKIENGKSKLVRSFIDENNLCQACAFLHSMKNDESTRRLNSQERKDVIDAALTWADKHLPKKPMADGTEGARLTLETSDGYELHIGKKLFTETYSKCKNSRRLAETMEVATHVDEWARTATHFGFENGRHHNYDFEVFRAEYNGKIIEFKAKTTDGLIVYIMRLL